MGLVKYTGRALASLCIIGLPVAAVSWLHQSYVGSSMSDASSETLAETSETLLIAMLMIYAPIALILLIRVLKRFCQRLIPSSK